MNQTTNLSTAVEIVRASVLANQQLTGRSSQYVTPMLWGVAGAGKTASIEALAQDMEIGFMDFRANQYDAGELGGLPWAQGDRMIRLRPQYLPTEGVGILFVDELPQAPVANQNIIGQLVNERRIGEHVLPDGWTVVCAGNQMHHRAGTNAMPSHLKDRLLHITIVPDLDDALQYMAANGIDNRILSFLRFQPEHLSKFDKDVNACPSPRSWEKAHQILSWNLSPMAQHIALCGTLGEGTTAMFEVHLQMCDAMPDIDAPFTDPDNAEIPSEPAMAYALCASLAYRVKKSTSANLVRFINRIPAQEYSAFAMKTVVNLNGKAEIRKWAHDVKEVRDWLTGDAKLLVLEEKAS